MVVPPFQARKAPQESQQALGVCEDNNGITFFSGSHQALLLTRLNCWLATWTFFEDVTLRKIRGLAEGQLRTSAAPSGRTPLGMVKHLGCTERYWVRHIFLGEQVDFSWPGDPVVGWRIDDSDTTDRIISIYRGERAYTRQALTGLLCQYARSAVLPARRRPPPTLGWVLCHLLEQAARHAGHLGIVRKLTRARLGFGGSSVDDQHLPPAQQARQRDDQPCRPGGSARRSSCPARC
jgi:Protein of unknown function (DUF664)